ncbi:MAG: PHP-associated domain-containing protein [Eubacteriales bacterium]|nr:PHP-associated domain-containing protein [Eubacteriales bacterium]
MKHVKFDLHCHTAEGSLDGKISIFDYAKILKDKGYGGMLVTDHDSYDGYRAYRDSDKKLDDFVVLRGIEYDTMEFGHFIIVLPVNTPNEVYRLLEVKGLTLSKLIYIVHSAGGTIGPAHPYGSPFLSFAATMYWKFGYQIFHMIHFDYVEGYNACESEDSNKRARVFAKRCKVPCIGGSDAHNDRCVGLGYAKLPYIIKNEDDFIRYYKRGNHPKVGGERYGMTTKDKIGKANRILVTSFYFYNKLGAVLNLPKRAKRFKEACSALGIKHYWR